MEKNVQCFLRKILKKLAASRRKSIKKPSKSKKNAVSRRKTSKKTHGNFTKIDYKSIVFTTFCSLAPRSSENFDVRVFCMRFPFDFDHYFVKSQRLMRGSATKKIFKKLLKKPGASRRKL